MKLLSKKELMQMPHGTLFCEWEPDICGRLHFYEGNRGDSDFWETDISEAAGEDMDESKAYPVGARMAALQAGKTIGVEFISCSAGHPEDDQMYLVWEAEDVQRLIDKLQSILSCNR